MNARYMGKKFDEYTESGYIVGEDDDDEAAASPFTGVGDDVDSDYDEEDSEESDYSDDNEEEEDDDVVDGVGDIEAGSMEMVKRDKECGLEVSGFNTSECVYISDWLL